MSVSFINPDSLADPRGYSHAAVGSGRPVVLAGQVGWDKEGRFASESDLAVQFAAALDNLLEALRAAGGAPTDLAHLRIFTTDVAQYRARRKELGAIYRERVGKHFPPMVLAGVAELFEPEALVEIEGLAYVD